MYTSIWLYITALMLQKLRWMTGDAKNVSVVCVQLFWVHYRYFFLCQGAGRVNIAGVGRTGFVNNPVQLSWSKEKKCCLFSHILWEIYCWKVLIKFFSCFSRKRDIDYTNNFSPLFIFPDVLRNVLLKTVN